MRIVFRTDSSSIIGIGHLIRCLSLADALQHYADEISFICRPHTGSRHQLVIERGYRLHLLPQGPLTPQRESDTQSPHETWLGDSVQNDLQLSRAILAGHGCDLLVVDHYGIDNRWQSGIRDLTTKLMVIDDLANRRHDCDYLLDQRPDATPADYHAWVPSDCKLLIGSRYALIHPAFRAARQAALQRRPTIRRPRRGLICMGGADPGGYSLEMVRIAAALDLEIDLVATTAFHNLEQLRAASRSTTRLHLHVNLDPTQMAHLVSRADIGFGAAGGAALERCCLGLPTLTLCIADNQRQQVRALADAGAIIAVDSLASCVDKLQHIISAGELNSIAAQAARLIDGQGISRVTKALVEHE